MGRLRELGHKSPLGERSGKARYKLKTIKSKKIVIQYGKKMGGI